MDIKINNYTDIFSFNSLSNVCSASFKVFFFVGSCGHCRKVLNTSRLKFYFDVHQELKILLLLSWIYLSLRLSSCRLASTHTLNIIHYGISLEQLSDGVNTSAFLMFFPTIALTDGCRAYCAVSFNIKYS